MNPLAEVEADDAIDQQERIAVRQGLENARDIEGFRFAHALPFAQRPLTGGVVAGAFAPPAAGGFAAPLLVVDLSSPAADAYPVVSTDERLVYFASNRGDGGTFQIYTSTRATASATWSTPSLVTELASFGNALPAWISPDACRLYLSSDQGGDYDMYVATKP